MHFSRMRTVRLLTVFCSARGGLPKPSPDADPPGCRPPSGHVTCDACWEGNPAPPPQWTEGMTHTCETITLPQTCQ